MNRVPEPIPVLVLAGALGSGKTTVLNHVLATSSARIGVIVNEFGALSVDSLLVEGHVDMVTSLSGGCICCISDSSQLDDALDSLTQPGHSLDAIVIESSGLGQPRALARTVLQSNAPGVRFGGLVLTVDAPARHQRILEATSPVVAGATHWSGVEIEDFVHPEHLAATSLVALTKPDKVPQDQLDAVEEDLQKQLTGADSLAPILHAPHGAIPVNALFDVRSHDASCAPGEFVLADGGVQQSVVPLLQEARRQDILAHDTHTHGHVNLVSSSARIDSPVDEEKYLDLFHNPAHGVVRMKGVAAVQAAHGALWRVTAHSVGGVMTFDRAPWRDEPCYSTVVAIGQNQVETLEAALRGAAVIA